MSNLKSRLKAVERLAGTKPIPEEAPVGLLSPEQLHAIPLGAKKEMLYAMRKRRGANDEPDQQRLRYHRITDLLQLMPSTDAQAILYALSKEVSSSGGASGR